MPDRDPEDIGYLIGLVAVFVGLLTSIPSWVFHEVYVFWIGLAALVAGLVVILISALIARSD